MCENSGRSNLSPKSTPCEACNGSGAISGMDLGIVGFCADDGEAIHITCIVCDGTGVDAIAEDTLAPSPKAQPFRKTAS